MKPESRQRFRFVEEVVDDLLRPCGFVKQKAIWRRNIKEVLQQFSIVSMQKVPEAYLPSWGLNILHRCEDPKPLPWKLSVQWLLGMTVKDIKRKLEFLDAFAFGLELPNRTREQHVTDLLTHYVIPCFDNVTTEDAVRAMMGDRSYPMRAQAYVRLPDEWWPGGKRATGSGTPHPPIVRRWNPQTGAMDEVEGV